MGRTCVTYAEHARRRKRARGAGPVRAPADNAGAGGPGRIVQEMIFGAGLASLALGLVFSAAMVWHSFDTGVGNPFHRTTSEPALVFVVFTGLLVLFLLQWGQYPCVGSYYVRYLPVALMAGTALVAFRAAGHRPWLERQGWRKGAPMTFLAAGALMFAVLNWKALQAHSVDVPTVNMEFPLRGGIWYISAGGSNSVLNLHHKPHTPAQHYAIDIDRLDAFGRYASGLIPDRVEDHLIFGATIHSPCAGEVLESRDGVADHPPFEYDPDSGGGNQVVLECSGIQVALLHMMQGSVLAEPGDQVAVGEPLGRVGNSGFSVQPHLHLQAT